MRAKSTFKISYVYYRRGGLQIHKDKLLVVAPNPRSADQLLAQLLARLHRRTSGTPSRAGVPADVGADKIRIFRRALA